MPPSPPDPTRPTPDVSVIIPATRGPGEVMTAVDSVLAQTHASLELIVVLEGERPATRAALAACGDPRLRVLENPVPLGGSEARNRGADAARGEQLAFLDDDDAWTPQKLERQLALQRQGGGGALVTCLSTVRTPLGDYIWPRRPYSGPGAGVGAWLFDRRGLLKGGSFLQTSSLMAPRALFERVRFARLPQHEDWDFVLRAAEAGAALLTVEEPLVVHLAEDSRERLSAAFDWRRSLDWARSRRGVIGARGFAGLCLTVIGPQAAKSGDRRAFAALLGAACREGRPRPIQLALYLAFWASPMGLRPRLRRRVSGRRVQPAAAA